jgi:hypothetical protein
MGLPKSPRATNSLINFLKNIVDNGLENFGKYYSRYRGFVFDNDDPENLGRLKLIIPAVTGPDYHGTWAFPVGVPSGKGWGQQVIPNKGDVVWVEFEGGCPELPLWSHGHFGRKEIPTDDTELADKDCYWFITPKGAKVKINDTKNTIHVRSQLGDIIEINEKGVSLVTKKAISLGQLNKSAEQGVLGNKLEDLLKDIVSLLDDLHTNMNKDVAQYTAKTLTSTAGILPKMTKRVAGLKDKLNLILSKKITLD